MSQTIDNYEPQEASQDDVGAPAVEDQEINALDVAIILAKHKRLLLVAPLVAAVLAAGISLLLPNIYTGMSKIIPPQQSQSTASAMLGQLGLASMAGVAGGAVGLKNPNDTYISMLKSRTVADSLIGRFDLKKRYGATLTADARNALAGNSRILAGKDGLITVEFDDKDPKFAAAVTNGYVEELYKLTQTMAITEASQRRLFFEKQLELTKNNLAQAEMGLRQTQEVTGLIKLDDQARALISAVASVRAQIAAKEVQLGAMRVFATENNAEFVVAQKELAGLTAQLARLERNNRTAPGDFFVPTGKVPEVGLEYVRKLRDVKYFETMFELLAKQYEIAKADEARDSSVIQVLDKAIEPERKSKPQRSYIVLITAFVAGLMAVLWVFIKEAGERIRQNPQQAQRLHLLRRYVWSR
jgi:uncharacterized protein involved in exopolysaccharide biosynthesis